MTRCDWACCSCEAAFFDGKWWHCTPHYKLHLEFQVEDSRLAAGDIRYMPRQERNPTPKRVRERSAYKARWMAAKRAAARL